MNDLQITSLTPPVPGEITPPDACAEAVGETPDFLALLAASLGMDTRAATDVAREAPSVACPEGDGVDQPSKAPKRSNEKSAATQPDAPAAFIASLPDARAFVPVAPVVAVPRETPAGEQSVDAAARDRAPGREPEVPRPIQAANLAAESAAPVQLPAHEKRPEPFSAALHAQESLASVQAPGAPPPVERTANAEPSRVALPTPVGSPSWPAELAGEVKWLATSRIQSAELHLQPPELGPVHVSLRIEASEASVAFVAAHADTRDALEAALPQLREALAAGGLFLGDASVGHPGNSGGQPGQHPAARDGADIEREPEHPVAAIASRLRSLVDVFA